MYLTLNRLKHQLVNTCMTFRSELTINVISAVAYWIKDYMMSLERRITLIKGTGLDLMGSMQSIKWPVVRIIEGKAIYYDINIFVQMMPTNDMIERWRDTFKLYFERELNIMTMNYPFYVNTSTSFQCCHHVDWRLSHDSYHRWLFYKANNFKIGMK